MLHISTKCYFMKLRNALNQPVVTRTGHFQGLWVSAGQRHQEDPSFVLRISAPHVHIGHVAPKLGKKKTWELTSWEYANVLEEEPRDRSKLMKVDSFTKTFLLL